MFSPLQQSATWIEPPPVRAGEYEDDDSCDSSCGTCDRLPIELLLPTRPLENGIYVPCYRDRSNRYPQPQVGAYVLVDEYFYRIMHNTLLGLRGPGGCVSFSFGRLGTVLVNKQLVSGFVATLLEDYVKQNTSYACAVTGFHSHARVNIEFINGNRLDYRVENLRVTHKPNSKKV